MNKQGRSSKRELENLGVTFRNTDDTGEEIEIQWKTSFGYETLRAYITNRGETFILAMPGLGGTFNLSYRYLLHCQATKGFDFFLNWIETSESGSRFLGKDYWNRTVASVIDVARTMARNAYKNNEWHYR